MISGAETTTSRRSRGSSITAANLAVCLAEGPATRVCLIDADFRSPAQAGILGLPNEPGLAGLLAGGEEAMLTVEYQGSEEEALATWDLFDEIIQHA